MSDDGAMHGQLLHIYNRGTRTGTFLDLDVCFGERDLLAAAHAPRWW